MKVTEAKRMLQDIRISRIEIQALEERRELIEARAVRITRNLTGMPSARNTRTDLSDNIAGLLELDEVLKKRIEILSRKESDVVRLITEIDSAKHRTLLTLYYIAGKHPMTWDDVADQMGYSRSAVCHEHGNALVELQKIIDHNKSLHTFAHSNPVLC